MDWLLVLLDFGCMVFIAKIAMEHAYQLKELQPRIDELIARAEVFARKAEDEAETRNAARSRLPEQKDEVRRLEAETEEVRRNLQRAWQDAELLALKANQKHFKEGVRTGRRSTAVRGALAAAG